MKIRRSLKFALVSCTLLAMFGCGGGGGGETLTVTPGAPGPTGTPTASTAALKVNTLGTLPAGTLIGGVDVTINLPAGVTCAAAADGTTATDVVTASGNPKNVAALGKFTAASGSTPAQLRLQAASGDGFTIGQFATINVNFTGDPPVNTSFAVAGTPVIFDVNTNALSGLTIDFSK